MQGGGIPLAKQPVAFLVNSKQTLRLLTQLCGIDILYNKVLFRYLCASNI